MTQTRNRFLDEFAKFMTDAAGMAQGVGREAHSVLRGQGERVLREFDVVQREQFEAVKAMIAAARSENERLSAELETLKARVADLEAKLR